MNIVERYKRFKAIVQDDYESGKEEPEQTVSYKDLRKTLSRDLLNQIFYFRNNYDKIKEATVYNIMKKHEFKMDLVENEIRMMTIGKKKFQKDAESQKNSKLNSSAKHSKQKNRAQKKTKVVDEYVLKEQQPKKKTQKGKKVSKTGRIAKWTDTDAYFKNEEKQQQTYQRKEKQPSPESFYKSKEKKKSFEYVKKSSNKKKRQRIISLSDLSDHEEEDAQPVKQSKIQIDIYDKALGKLKFIFKHHLFCSFKEIKACVRLKQKSKKDSPKPKPANEGKYKKKAIDIAREFVNDIEESSVNEKGNWLDKRMVKEFQSEDERMRIDREKKLERKVNNLVDIINSMQNRINELELDMAKLTSNQSLATKETSQQKSTFCLVPFEKVQHLFTPVDDKKSSVETSDINMRFYDYNGSGS